MSRREALDRAIADLKTGCRERLSAPNATVGEIAEVLAGMLAQVEAGREALDELESWLEERSEALRLFRREVLEGSVEPEEVVQAAGAVLEGHDRMRLRELARQVVERLGAPDDEDTVEDIVSVLREAVADGTTIVDRGERGWLERA